jgi:transposase
MVDEGKSQSEVAQIFRVHGSTICRLASERRVSQKLLTTEQARLCASFKKARLACFSY